ncbi:uncharacterized [Tachysurus ichikawai]
MVTPNPEERFFRKRFERVEKQIHYHIAQGRAALLQGREICSTPHNPLTANPTALSLQDTNFLLSHV